MQPIIAISNNHSNNAMSSLFYTDLFKVQFK